MIYFAVFRMKGGRGKEEVYLQRFGEPRGNPGRDKPHLNNSPLPRADRREGKGDRGIGSTLKRILTVASLPQNDKGEWRDAGFQPPVSVIRGKLRGNDIYEGRVLDPPLREE